MMLNAGKARQLKRRTGRPARNSTNSLVGLKLATLPASAALLRWPTATTWLPALLNNGAQPQARDLGKRHDRVGPVVFNSLVSKRKTADLGATALANGNYVVSSPSGITARQRAGAVTGAAARV
jgi:hypothetical protein